MQGLTRDDLVQRLLDFDEEMFLRYGGAIEGERFHIVIVGGGALLLSGMIFRATHDMDAINISPELCAFMEPYDINTHVSAHIDTFAPSYPDRIKLLDIKGKVIDFYTASLEDIVIAKLCAYRDSDIADITNQTVLNAIDWELLHRLATDEDELKATMLSDYRYNEFLFRYNEYEGRCRPCGN